MLSTLNRRHLLKSSLQVDLRVIPLAIFGAALHYFTGSKNHNIRIRDRAKKMGLKVNEYGVFRLPVKEGGEEVFVAGATEEELFSTIHLAWIPPEMREDRGEVELSEKLFAKKKKMPELVSFPLIPARRYGTLYVTAADICRYFWMAIYVSRSGCKVYRSYLELHHESFL
jgi:hypothetical protein